MPLPSLPATHQAQAFEWRAIADFTLAGFVRKAYDQSLTSNTTLQDDNALVLPVVANATYWVKTFIIYTAGTTGDLKLAFSAPSGTTFDWGLLGPDGSAASAVASGAWGAFTITDVNGFAGGVGAQAVVIRPGGLLVVSATPGTFRFRWAQSTSDGTATIVKAGSAMYLRRVA